jgi:hypothetical protein
MILSSTQKACSNSYPSLTVGQVISTNASYHSATKATVDIAVKSGNVCQALAQYPVRITNTYDAGSVTPPPPTTGTATWTSVNPAQLSAVFTGGSYTSSTTETFNQFSTVNNVMTLTGINTPADTRCSADNILIGSDATGAPSYLDATTAELITYTWGYVGSDLGCVSNVVYVAVQNSQKVATSYAGAGGLPVATVSSNAANTCPINGSFGLGWLLCPVYFLAHDTIIALLKVVIQTFLYVDTTQLFGTQNNPSSFQAGYNILRNLGLALLVIAGLAMVMSQATGLDIFSAYAVKKALPRIVVAAILMALAWPLLQFAITLSNDLGAWVGGIIMTAAHTNNATDYNGAGTAVVNLIFLGTSAGVLVLTFGVIGGLSFIFTFAIALFTGFMVLVIRQLVVILCVLLAPLAIAASVLPGTEKLWAFWKDTFLGVLLMFPIVMGFLAAGAAVSVVAGNAAQTSSNGLPLQLLSMIAFFAPYFMLTTAFSVSSRLMGTVTGLANNASKGALNGLSKYRQGEKEYMHQQRMTGQRGITSFNGLNNSKIGSGLASAYRRSHIRGGALAWGGNAKERIDTQLRQMQQAASADIIKNDLGIASGDDTINRLLSKGYNRSQILQSFVENDELKQEKSARKEYMKNNNGSDAGFTFAYTPDMAKNARRRATSGLNRAEGSYKSIAGTRGIMAAAHEAVNNSGTGYLDQGTDTEGEMRANMKERYADAAHLVDLGIIDEDKAARIKFNQGLASRPEIAAAGYGANLEAVQTSRENTKNAAMGRATVDVTEKVLKSVRANLKPGQLGNARTESLNLLAPDLATNLQAAYDRWGADPDNQAKHDEVAQLFAQTGKMYEVLAQIGTNDASILGQKLMGAQLNVSGVAAQRIAAAQNTQRTAQQQAAAAQITLQQAQGNAQAITPQQLQMRANAVAQATVGVTEIDQLHYVLDAAAQTQGFNQAQASELVNTFDQVASAGQGNGLPRERALDQARAAVHVRVQEMLQRNQVDAVASAQQALQAANRSAAASQSELQKLELLKGGRVVDQLNDNWRRDSEYEKYRREYNQPQAAEQAAAANQPPPAP